MSDLPQSGVTILAPCTWSCLEISPRSALSLPSNTSRVVEDIANTAIPIIAPNFVGAERELRAAFEHCINDD
ncbi:unnamed protein product [Ceratitis capitata]|uniref:(Mediterranean fruit fly) hypothetical protein n=1 Tax=Ceratitis capitata TaxID=7213 RepID=A0A811UWG4_CERCA|nr:unnamed protein product [Ceratitis capitata]